MGRGWGGGGVVKEAAQPDDEQQTTLGSLIDEASISHLQPVIKPERQTPLAAAMVWASHSVCPGCCLLGRFALFEFGGSGFWSSGVQDFGLLFCNCAKSYIEASATSLSFQSNLRKNR